jgi:endonuclease/exonuclease/phosphatase family metal-dependent hydrolase
MHHGDVTPEIAAGLLALRKRIEAAKIPPSKLDESINVAAWNIREFGRVHRTEPAIHYIAEILGQFDLIALVELRADLTDLGRVLRYLGPAWRVVFSDWIDDAGGNRERIAFLFDRRAVIHNGLAAEVDAPRAKAAKEYLATKSFWRAPYMCAFRAGNFDFITIATHIRWGDSIEARMAELELLSEWIDTRFKNKFAEDHDLLVMGDFNTPKITDPIFDILLGHGLKIPQPLVKLTVGDRVIGGSNLGFSARYDQILHRATMPENFTNKGGALDFYINDAGIEELFPGKNYSRTKFTFQMSDHLPIWIQVKTDIDGYRLDQIVQDAET